MTATEVDLPPVDVETPLPSPRKALQRMARFGVRRAHQAVLLGAFKLSAWQVHKALPGLLGIGAGSAGVGLICSALSPVVGLGAGLVVLAWFALRIDGRVS